LAGRRPPYRGKADKPKEEFEKGGEEMFWGKTGNGLLRPKSIPEAVGRYLVVSLGQNPDWVWNLKAVMRSNGADKDSFEVRIFDPSRTGERGIKVIDYNTFDEHPEMILYEGWFNKRTFESKIQGMGKSG
jgi:hypothetical protein